MGKKGEYVMNVNKRLRELMDNMSDKEYVEKKKEEVRERMDRELEEGIKVIEGKNWNKKLKDMSIEGLKKMYKKEKEVLGL